jgi:hypothetical protein
MSRSKKEEAIYIEISCKKVKMKFNLNYSKTEYHLNSFLIKIVISARIKLVKENVKSFAPPRHDLKYISTIFFPSSYPHVVPILNLEKAFTQASAQF